jgi:hypothetical protein
MEPGLQFRRFAVSYYDKAWGNEEYEPQSEGAFNANPKLKEGGGGVGQTPPQNSI